MNTASAHHHDHVSAISDRRRSAIRSTGAVPDRILTTPTGLTFPREVSVEEWERAGRQIARIANSSAWYLGDWLVYGQNRYVDRYRRVVDLVGLDYRTLRNYAWVARSYEYSRRRVGLSFQHHADLASLPHDEQDYWLDLTTRQGWSRSQLRKALREHRDGETTSDRTQLPRVTVPRVDIELWRRAAAEADADFEAWIVAALNRVAEAELRRPSRSVT